MKHEDAVELIKVIKSIDSTLTNSTLTIMMFQLVCIFFAFYITRD